jgi:8-oxo-dGTP pyrophosphatase MutT (NUDIX family)
MPILKHKVFAYITHGRRLLVFRHPYSPTAGIQVPAGTMLPGERPEEAVLREAHEETGLVDLKIAEFLGEQIRDMADFDRDETHHRFFYHLLCLGDPPATWRPNEVDPSDGDIGPIVFEFFWAALPHGIPELIADHGKFLSELLSRLSLEEDVDL